MKDRKVWYVIGGILAINSAALYGIFRIATTFIAIYNSPAWFDRCMTLVFFCSEAFIIVNAMAYFLNILTAAYSYERPRSLLGARRSWPAVTVFLPMKNESVDLVIKTFAACSFLTYPNLKVVVVDSSDDPTHQRKVQRAAESFGLTFFMTPYPRHGAKAGALNEAMRVYQTPYYVIFDADYHPVRNAVSSLVSQMEADPSLAYIQTPQFYGDLVSSMVSRVSQIQQSIFYEYISEGKSMTNSMFMCGTNLIIRRKAILSVGGWDETSITEDFSTSVELAKKGWSSRFDNHVIAFGMGPINLQGYLKQQYRWSRGTFGVFLKNFFTLLNPFGTLTVSQRTEYILSGVYFLVGFVWMIFILTPVFYIFFRIPTYSSDPLLFTIAYIPYFILSFVFFGGAMRHRKFHLLDLLRAQSLTLMTLPVYIRAFFHAMVGYRETFVTTSKSGAPYDIPWQDLRVQMVIISLNVLAVVYGLATLPTATNVPALLTNIAWAVTRKL